MDKISNRRHYWVSERHPEFVRKNHTENSSKQDLRESVKTRLQKNKLTQTWLIHRLEDYGLITDKTELSSVLSGTRHGAKVDTLLEVSDEILSKYETGMSSV